jgi:hypothetical protein
MTVSAERLMAFADGMLDPESAQEVERAIAANPALAAEVERHRALKRSLVAAYDPVLEEPAPAALTALFGKAAPVAELEEARLRRARTPGVPTRFVAPAAMAAGLAMGIVFGGALSGRSALLGEGPDGLVARHELSRALDQRLASEPDPRALVQVGLSFRDRQGRWCRTFTVRREDGFAGLACRTGDAWALKATATVASRPEGQFETAAAGLPPEILAAVDRTIGGEPADAAAERAARQSGWKGAAANDPTAPG